MGKWVGGLGLGVGLGGGGGELEGERTVPKLALTFHLSKTEPDQKRSEPIGSDRCVSLRFKGKRFFWWGWFGGEGQGRSFTVWLLNVYCIWGDPCTIIVSNVKISQMINVLIKKWEREKTQTRDTDLYQSLSMSS